MSPPFLPSAAPSCRAAAAVSTADQPRSSPASTSRSTPSRALAVCPAIHSATDAAFGDGAAIRRCSCRRCGVICANDAIAISTDAADGDSETTSQSAERCTIVRSPRRSGARPGSPPRMRCSGTSTDLAHFPGTGRKLGSPAVSAEQAQGTSRLFHGSGQANARARPRLGRINQSAYMVVVWMSLSDHDFDFAEGRHRLHAGMPIQLAGRRAGTNRRGSNLHVQREARAPHRSRGRRSKSPVPHRLVDPKSFPAKILSEHTCSLKLLVHLRSGPGRKSPERMHETRSREPFGSLCR